MPQNTRATTPGQHKHQAAAETAAPPPPAATAVLDAGPCTVTLSCGPACTVLWDIQPPVGHQTWCERHGRVRVERIAPAR